MCLVFRPGSHRLHPQLTRDIWRARSDWVPLTDGELEVLREAGFSPLRVSLFFVIPTLLGPAHHFEFQLSLLVLECNCEFYMLNVFEAADEYLFAQIKFI